MKIPFKLLIILLISFNLLQIQKIKAQPIQLTNPPKKEFYIFRLPLYNYYDHYKSVPNNKINSCYPFGDVLVARAVLPAASFAKGPTSGRYIGKKKINSQSVPFINKQPIQGFSAALNNYDGTFTVLSDNGFGTIENSIDYNLRLYKIAPSFKTNMVNQKEGIEVLDYIELKDPNNLIPFAIVNNFSERRVLTGADFDIESIQRTENGDYWIGDEFGPFILHFDSNGVLLDPPIPLPDFDEKGKELRSPQNPYNEESSALRVMNAVRAHAEKYHAKENPTLTTWHLMLDDGDSNTVVPSRKNPVGKLKPASSEIYNINSIQKSGHKLVVYTVNDSTRMRKLLNLGLDGIITDRPDLLLSVLKTVDKNKDGKSDYMTHEGLIDINKFDAEGHRGARNLRPENTLPAMEVALDYLMPTLETDFAITSDGEVMLNHDAYIKHQKTRKVNGETYGYEDEILIKDVTKKYIQSNFIMDGILPNRPVQTNNVLLSPVSVAFAKKYGYISPYTMPSIQEFFDFVKFYENYYKYGKGRKHPSAIKRWKNASRVRFNLEIKTNPRTDKDAKGNVFIERTFDYKTHVKKITKAVLAYRLEKRSQIQCFDLRPVLYTQKMYPSIRTGCLFGDFPKVGNKGDGTGFQDQNGKNTPWLAGMYWPYRQTKLNAPFKIKRSAGFEGMAITTDGKTLLPLLEKPLLGIKNNELLIHEFDIETKRYTGVRYKYPLHKKASSIGDFIMFSKERGLIIERDGTQGDLLGFKTIYEIDINKEEQKITKQPMVNLLKINDEFNISERIKGDVGVGKQFAFPFETIESVIAFNPFMIGVLNDNNYPFSVGRHIAKKLPDDNEFIILWLKKPLGRKWTKRAKKYYDSLVDNIKVAIYPNIFKDYVKITTIIPARSMLSINIYNIKGELVKKLVDNEQTNGGTATYNWDGRFDYGAMASSGIYIAIIKINGEFVKKKIIKM